MDSIFDMLPYSLNKSEKEKLLNKKMKELAIHHYENCPEYRRIMDVLHFYPYQDYSYTDVPFLPVRMFK